MRKTLFITLALAGMAALPCRAALAGQYEVGPGKEYKAVIDVPWEKLAPGDTVLIHWRSEPYKEKFNIAVEGTREAPFTVRGVPGPNGELPVIDGRDAVTRPGAAFGNENRSVVQVGPFKDKAAVPSNIVIENLEIRSGRSPYTFTDSGGARAEYLDMSSSVRWFACDGVTMRNCVIHDSGNGTLSSHDTMRITVEGCYYHDNGFDGDGGVGVHSTYTETLGFTYQYNRFGELRAGCPGSNVKDRSSSNVVRYNWIEGGNKSIDFPDSRDSEMTRNDPGYRRTFCYGNILIKPADNPSEEMVTYGGDMGEEQYYRKGTLYFYNNTCVSMRARTTIFKIKTDSERVDARNNIFYTTHDGKTLAVMYSNGRMVARNNWVKPGCETSFHGFSGAIDEAGTMTGLTPGFANESARDYHLSAASQCIDAGSPLAPECLPANDVTLQYVTHQKTEPRPKVGKLDIGAYEYPTARTTSPARSAAPAASARPAQPPRSTRPAVAPSAARGTPTMGRGNGRSGKSSVGNRSYGSSPKSKEEEEEDH